MKFGEPPEVKIDGPPVRPIDEKAKAVIDLLHSNNSEHKNRRVTLFIVMLAATIIGGCAFRGVVPSWPWRVTLAILLLVAIGLLVVAIYRNRAAALQPIEDDERYFWYGQRPSSVTAAAIAVVVLILFLLPSFNTPINFGRAASPAKATNSATQQTTTTTSTTTQTATVAALPADQQYVRLDKFREFKDNIYNNQTAMRDGVRQLKNNTYAIQRGAEQRLSALESKPARVVIRERTVTRTRTVTQRQGGTTRTSVTHLTPEQQRLAGQIKWGRQ